MRTRQKRIATDTWRSLGCRTTELMMAGEGPETVYGSTESDKLMKLVVRAFRHDCLGRRLLRGTHSKSRVLE